MKETRTFKNRRDADPGEAYTVDGGKTWRWNCNDAVIRVDVCRQYGIPCDEQAQQQAYEGYVDERLSKYRETAQEDSAELAFELRAAFGPGKEVVNIITGKKYKT